MASTIDKETLKQTTYPLVELFTLDATVLGGSVYYFTPMTNYVGPHTGQPADYVRFGGIVYTPFPIETTNWEYSIDGAPGKPKLAVSNATKFLQAAVISLGDLVGAKLTRTRTFMNFLDGQPDADPTKYFPRDIFYIDQKTLHNKNVIEWSLISSVERGNVMLPLRQILRDEFPGVSRIRLK